MDNLDICKDTIARKIFSKRATSVLEEESKEILERERIKTEEIEKMATTEAYYKEFKRLYDELYFQTTSSNLPKEQKDEILEKGKNDIINMVVGKRTRCMKWLRKYNNFILYLEDNDLLLLGFFLLIGAVFVTPMVFFLKIINILEKNLLFSCSISVLSGLVPVCLIAKLSTILQNNIDHLACSCRKCRLRERVFPKYSKNI